MHFQRIKRRCGHEEQVGFAGGYGDMTDISKEKTKEMIDDYDEATAKSLREAEAKLCVDCFMKLSPTERWKEFEKHE